MASALKLALVASIAGKYTGSNDVAAPVQTLNHASTVQLATGTTAGQADLMFTDERTLAASTSESLDLAGGLTDAFGATLGFAEIVGLLIEADAGNTNDVVVGGAASNAFLGPFADATDKLKVKPGGFAFLAAPTDPAWPVTGGTGDLLQVANGGAGSAVTYTVTVIGRSA